MRSGEKDCFYKLNGKLAIKIILSHNRSKNNPHISDFKNGYQKNFRVKNIFSVSNTTRYILTSWSNSIPLFKNKQVSKTSIGIRTAIKNIHTDSE